ncbi:MAG: Tryptophan synthase beta chain [Candidatus Beckwithbacteria bacterium GW2011_GWB1_47_15]|uniref:Tryptophan synthase beta chain n=1 Tax=Candidatus Beckwithbacteria bacterium GW2011_GWB1_47_15 TaxID=1618371 RepID=A0A0G1RVS2_9BACT|nr:MAG: pyridoxal-phosphate dependent TrpB-like protein enzyme [Candidatus Beckwithbacteria bacterium GW2011_GWC1_49_16]KKU35516.1 MAG: Tryptophan synthase beta chain [Candidatus Beckwithbacteria bacterium GW2011_GWA1_46_30]KKU61191.1 MAG: Tryptophan synthase beta chain [Candidatus Beckwithbacteria bacterium GW2011_GWB1_47_15]KKU72030.1 MAG: Tryptophan synthase beta chain [Candidatus Beckwithbacteria bacterium GW2011_GWA2_47_25]KKW03268.1 MAG: Tryptophan synthase beta chain [Candidatus Beckwith
MNIPQRFLNLNYYLQKYLGELPPPPLHPASRQPVGPEDLTPLFPMELIKQEVSVDEFVDIPDEVREIYKLYRPSPLIRAKRLEKALKTPARIYYKYEGVSPAGSHKLNTALVQAYYSKKEGVKRLVTETGAGQWGSALALATKFFGLKCLVYMVKISFEQKPYRRVVMELFDAKVVPSPSKKTRVGRSFLKQYPRTHGSLGMAIAEAIEVAAGDEATKYSLGSVLNHVLLHQTVIGLEAKDQFKALGDEPDVVIGCCGGGSNFSGLAFPFLVDKLSGKKPNRRFVGVEPSSCASMSKGEYRYDFGDTGQQTPLLKMETLGSDFVPPPIHAGGLRYHGIAPTLAFLHQKKLVEAKAYDQVSVFRAAQEFAHSEGVIPAPESAHAIKAAIDEALRCRRQRKAETIIFNLSGHGLLDLKGYEDFLAGSLR